MKKKTRSASKLYGGKERYLMKSSSFDLLWIVKNLPGKRIEKRAQVRPFKGEQWRRERGKD